MKPGNQEAAQNDELEDTDEEVMVVVPPIHDPKPDHTAPIQFQSPEVQKEPVQPNKEPGIHEQVVFEEEGPNPKLIMQMPALD